MIDYFLSGFNGCCLNCPEEERRILCSGGNWCDRCLCLKGCEYYRRDAGIGKGYCSVRRDLLDWLEAECSANLVGVRSWLGQIKSQGVRIPKSVREITEIDQQTKLF